MRLPILALTQGDPAGIGPEILLRILSDPGVGSTWAPLIIAEQAALNPLRSCLPEAPWDRFYTVGPNDIPNLGSRKGWIPLLDPVGEPRLLQPGAPSPADARGALAALDMGVSLARKGQVDALVTAPLSKAQIATHQSPGFLGHTDYLAAACGSLAYGRDYLMAFLTPRLNVALLSTHLSLRQALDRVSQASTLQALRCMGRHVKGKIALAGLNPHAGEGGLMGREEMNYLEPAVKAAREEGLDVFGPESPDTIFSRAAGGEFDWVLALYHDQGLIAVKTAAFGEATNWTLGLPFLRTSVDHGTAYDIAGQGLADPSSLRAVIETTLRLVEQRGGKGPK